VSKKIKQLYEDIKISVISSSNRNTILFAIIVNFLIEVLSRRSLSDSFNFIFEDPVNFINGSMIVFLTLSVSNLFRKKSFIFGFITTVWIGLGVSNFILLGFRTTPLAAIDFQILESVLGIITVYFNLTQIIMIVMALILVVIALGLSYVKLPKRKVHYKSAFISLALALSLVLVVPSFSLEEESSESFTNLVDAYDKFGFVYCFSNSIFDRGIEEPEDYSQEVMLEMREGLETNEKDPAFKPNIVFVELESFFDVNYLKGINYSQNPVPNFTRLKENYSSGKLTVPSIGAGTANTEFEILTGMSLDFFGSGEYPYKTVLRENTTESLAYNLGKLGYKSHAIHNNYGSFYDRHIVFNNLGFNSFSSLEYMYDVEYTPLGWAKDQVLVDEIMKGLRSTKERDFTFAISVQAHGKYPNLPLNVSNDILVDGYLNIEKQFALNYFVNQMYEVDRFIGQLVKELESHAEPTVVVFYGDHLPSLDIQDEDLVGVNKFQTEYVMWSNFPVEKFDKDLLAYQLGASILSRFEFDEGIITKYHQQNDQAYDYQEKLELLQYDMLYGEKYVFNQINPYYPKSLKMGLASINISDIKYSNEKLTVTGENFNEWSTVYIDEDEYETIFIDKNTIVVEEEIEESCSVSVAQQGMKGIILSQTDSYYIEIKN